MVNCEHIREISPVVGSLWWMSWSTHSCPHCKRSFTHNWSMTTSLLELRHFTPVFRVRCYFCDYEILWEVD